MRNYDKAIKYFGNSLSIMNQVLEEDHPNIATCYNNIGLVWDYKGDYEKALECYQKGLAIKIKILGEQHPDTIMSHKNIFASYTNFGNVYLIQGD